MRFNTKPLRRPTFRGEGQFYPTQLHTLKVLSELKVKN